MSAPLIVADRARRGGRVDVSRSDAPLPTTATRDFGISALIGLGTGLGSLFGGSDPPSTGGVTQEQGQAIQNALEAQLEVIEANRADAVAAADAAQQQAQRTPGPPQRPTPAGPTPSAQTRRTIDASIRIALAIYRALGLGVFARRSTSPGGVTINLPATRGPAPIPQAPFPIPITPPAPVPVIGGGSAGPDAGGSMPDIPLFLEGLANVGGQVANIISAINGPQAGPVTVPQAVPTAFTPTAITPVSSMLDVPFVDVVPQGATCIAPTTRTTRSLPKTVQMMNGNRVETYRRMGPALLYAEDFAAERRVKKVAGKARRRTGGR